MADINNSYSSNSSTSKYNYIFKLVLIGNAGSGKTSLINRYVNNKFLDSYTCTLGVDFFTRTIEVEDSVIKFQIWDTAGMEKFRSMTASHFKGCHAAFVVFDLSSRSSFEGVQKWIEEYNNQINPMFKRIVILLGNKNDLINQKEITDEELDVFIKNNNVLYWSTSAKTGQGIEAAFETVGKLLFDHYKNTKEQTKNTKRVKSILLEKSSYIAITKEKKKKCC